MERRIYDETNGLSYRLEGDYYIPELQLPKEENAHYGKYRRLRLQYLKEHKKVLYTSLLLEGMLMKHLNEMDDLANERVDILISQMKRNEGITEQVKAEQQMLWVRWMNRIKSIAEEVVLKEIVFA